MGAKTRMSLAGGIILLMTLCLGFSGQKPQWKGILSDEDGVGVVKSPKKPAFGEGAFALKTELSIGKPSVKEGPLFSHVWALAVDEEENIYAMDQGETRLMVFDKKGILLRTFGKKGQGPGELQNPNSIFITGRPELVIEDYIRNLTYYALDGRYLRTAVTARIFPIEILLDPSGGIFALRNIPDPEKPGKEIDLYDPTLNFIRTIVVVPQTKPDPSVIELFRAEVQCALLNDGNVVVSRGDAYELEVYNNEGKLVRKIIRDYDLVRITEEDVKQQTPKNLRGRKLVVPKYFPSVRSLTTDDEGRIFVGTNEKAGEGKFVYDVFDSAGRYVAAVAFKGEPKVWKTQKLYAIEEDEDGYPFIKRYATVWTLK